MAAIAKKYEEELRRLARDAEGEGYGKWLISQKKGKASTADRARQTAAGEDVRAQIGYGAAGEALSRTGLADDGYANYLRAAAKNAREDRILAIEDERVGEERAALSGYADYLEDVRRKEGDRLVGAAEDLLAMRTENEDVVNAIIKSATDDPRAALALRRIRKETDYIPPDSSKSAIANVVARIQDHYYSYDRAYRYCRLLGYDEERAKEIAAFATEQNSELSDKLSDLFKD